MLRVLTVTLLTYEGTSLVHRENARPSQGGEGALSDVDDEPYCPSWCGRHSMPWADKCTWRHCKECLACCDPGKQNLLDFRQWQEETDPQNITQDTDGRRSSDAFWWGEYTFLGPEGDAYETEKWPYPYDHYWGFIRMKIVGNTLQQRNIFVYPPATVEMCNANGGKVAEGLNGSCGINGAEKVFKADQTAFDCKGNLAGPFGSGMQSSDTYTYLTGDGSSILYQVKTPNYSAMGLPMYASFSGKLLQSQLTTLPGDGLRVRTAQGFDFNGNHQYASYYREFRSATATQWIQKLKEIRGLVNVLPQDLCRHDGAGGGLIENPDCFTHMLLEDHWHPEVLCADMNAGDPDGRCD